MMLKYAASLMEQFAKTLLDPIGQEGRLRALNALHRERGVEELPLIYPPTGKPTQVAEQYRRCLQILIDHAKESLDDAQAGAVVPDEFRIVEVVMDEGSTAHADGTA